jgi:dihydrolipoamide dehydrogenase
MERNVDVAIIGAGTAGLSALSRVRRHTDNWVLINGGELGTTCARVGCMPSKAAIQVAEDFHRRHIFDRHGIEGASGLSMAVADAMEHVRDMRDVFVDKVLSSSTDEMGDELIEGYARFLEPDLLEVDGQRIRAAKAVIIATGSRPIVPIAWQSFGDRVMTTDDLFEQENLPESIAVIGLGVIGLEMGQSLHRMGVHVTGFDQAETIGGLHDPAVNTAAVGLFGKEFPIHLGQPAEVTEEDGKLRVTAGEHSVLVDKVLAAMGRTPNLDRLDLEALGVNLDDRGMPEYDPHTMQVGQLPIFIAGDVTADRPILHEAGHAGRIAGYNAVADKVQAFKRKTPLVITFCDPNIAMVGARLDELDPDTTAIGEMNFGPLGRALIMGKNRGVLRIYADRADGRLRGAAMVGPKGENLAHLLAWCIEAGFSVFDVLKMPFYHPTIEEGVQGALYDLRGKVDLKVDFPEVEVME